MHLTKLWYLKNIDLLKCIIDEHAERLLQLTVMSRLKRNQDIYFPEQGSTHVYFVLEGHVKLSRLTNEGRPTILDVLCPGEIFGKLLIEGGDIPNEFAEADDDVTVCVISRSNFQALLAQLPEIHFHLAKRVGDRLQEFDEKISDLLFKDSTKRIISFLVRYAMDSGVPRGGQIAIETPLSHQEIAGLTGTSPRTVAMVMDELHRKKLIEFSKQSLEFNDFVGLKNLTQ